MTAERILIVDDNDANLRLLSYILEKKGYEVRCAVDAESTLATLATFSPQLILMDLQLPLVDGLELARRVRADPRFVDVPVVAVTAYAMKGDEKRAMDAGCDGYITKPIDTRALGGIVAGYLARGRSAAPG